jgi:hypothetical protein
MDPLCRIHAPLPAVPYVVCTAGAEENDGDGDDTERLCVLSAGLVHVVTLTSSTGPT